MKIMYLCTDIVIIMILISLNLFKVLVDKWIVNSVLDNLNAFLGYVSWRIDDYFNDCVI